MKPEKTIKKDLKTELRIILSEAKKELKCEFLDTKLQECIDIENFQHFSLTSSEIINKSILNCINAMILSCIGKEKCDITFSFIDANIILIKHEGNKWKINDIKLKLDPHFNNGIFLEQIKNCLKFFNVACTDLNSISFNITFSETNESLKHYKKELFKLKSELEEILGKELNI